MANGVSSLAAGLRLAYGSDALAVTATMTDRLSDVGLVAVVTVLLWPRARARVAFLVVSAGLLWAMSVPDQVLTALGERVSRSDELVLEAPLLAAMLLGSAALVKALREEDTPRAALALLLMVRFADLAATFLEELFGLPEDAATLGFAASRSVRALAIIAALTAFGVSLASRRSAMGRFAAMALAAGFVIGASRVGLLGAAPTAQTAVFFTIALVRPIGVLGVQLSLGRSRPAWVEGACRASPALLAFLTFLAIQAVWGYGIVPATAIGATIGLLSTPWLSRTFRRATRMEVTEKADEGEVAAARARLAGLSNSTRVRIQALTRWERLVLAILAAESNAGQGSARSTRGLQLVTGAPLASIGSEMKRLNARAGKVLAERGVKFGPSPPCIVAVASGRVEGSRSARVNVYTLTTEGRELALAIAREVNVPLGALAGVLHEDAGADLTVKDALP